MNTTGVADEDDVLEAGALLDCANCPRGDGVNSYRFAVLDPESYNSLVKTHNLYTARGVAGAIETGILPMLHGFKLFMSCDLAGDVSGTGGGPAGGTHNILGYHDANDPTMNSLIRSHLKPAQISAFNEIWIEGAGMRVILGQRDPDTHADIAEYVSMFAVALGRPEWTVDLTVV